jgi:hypothetical protein
MIREDKHKVCFWPAFLSGPVGNLVFVVVLETALPSFVIK